MRKVHSKNPTHDKKGGTCPKTPTAGPKTYWTPLCLGAARISNSNINLLTNPSTDKNTQKLGKGKMKRGLQKRTKVVGLSCPNFSPERLLFVSVSY